MLFAMLLFIFFAALLARSALITAGLLKAPILRTFEKYGDNETIYWPLPSLMLWGGLTLISGSLLLTATVHAWGPMAWPGVALVIGAYLAYGNTEIVQRYPVLLSYPRWYYHLRERTSRHERRRLAYMWLWLPPRLRLLYSASDRAFNQWADLVIMASMTFDEDSNAWRDLHTTFH